MAAAIATAGSDIGTRLVRVWQLPLTSRIIVMKRFLCAAFAIVCRANLIQFSAGR